MYFSVVCIGYNGNLHKKVKQENGYSGKYLEALGRLKDFKVVKNVDLSPLLNSKQETVKNNCFLIFLLSIPLSLLNHLLIIAILSL